MYIHQSHLRVTVDAGNAVDASCLDHWLQGLVSSIDFVRLAPDAALVTHSWRYR